MKNGISSINSESRHRSGVIWRKAKNQSEINISSIVISMKASMTISGMKA